MLTLSLAARSVFVLAAAAVVALAGRSRLALIVCGIAVALAVVTAAVGVAGQMAYRSCVDDRSARQADPVEAPCAREHKVLGIPSLI